MIIMIIIIIMTTFTVNISYLNVIYEREHRGAKCRTLRENYEIVKVDGVTTSREQQLLTTCSRTNTSTENGLKSFRELFKTINVLIPHYTNTQVTSSAFKILLK